MTDARSAVLEALRRYAVSYQESAYRFAGWMGLPTSDGSALGEIIWAEQEGKPLSPARLSTRIGLTSGATNALINRLEAHDLVVRSREGSDRRIVTLRATGSARARAAGFIDGPARELDAALSDYDEETLETVRGFVDRFAAILPGAERGSTSPPGR